MGSSPIRVAITQQFDVVQCASVAQSVEQGTENPRVGGSIPPGGTNSSFYSARNRKAALNNMPVACCNRRGFSAEKRFRPEALILVSVPQGIEKRFLAICRWHVATGVGFPQKSEYADVAHLVERHLAKVEVASSSLVIRSIWYHSQVVRRGTATP